MFRTSHAGRVFSSPGGLRSELAGVAHLQVRVNDSTVIEVMSGGSVA